MTVDAQGLLLTGASPAAAAAYDTALAQLLSFTGDPVGTIETALVEDPGFLMGHALRAALMLLGTDRQFLPEALVSTAAAQALAEGGSERELWHVAAVTAWTRGQMEEAADAWEHALLLAPRDALALIAAHQCDFFLGASASLRDRVARVLPAWDADTPGYNFVLGMHAFGLEEMGDYAAAEQAGMAAVQLFPRDAWAIHAVAHTYESQGRITDGIAWLAGRTDDWSVDNFFAVHNWWHLSLYHLDAEQPASVLAIYDDKIRAGHSTAMLDLVDAAALLWRLDLAGVDTAARWPEVAAAWSAFAEDRWYAFNDLHAMMAFAATRDAAAARNLLGALAETAQTVTTTGRMAREVHLPAAQALWAFGSEDYQAALDLLLPIRYIAARGGGSHAQRDLIHQTVIEAAARSGNVPLARALLRERLALKPTSPHNWLWLARATGEADPSTAAYARDQARRRAAALVA